MSSPPKPERRRYTRIRFKAGVHLTQNNASFASHLVDVSLNGILVDTPQNYEISTDLPVDVCIQLTNDAEIRMRTRLVHSSSSVLGFKCESIDIDSLGHLRRLIELNIDEPNAAERVLNELVTPQASDA